MGHKGSENRCWHAIQHTVLHHLRASPDPLHEGAPSVLDEFVHHVLPDHESRDVARDLQLVEFSTRPE